MERDQRSSREAKKAGDAADGDSPEEAPRDDARPGDESPEPESRAPWGALSEIQAAVGDLMDTALRGVSPGTSRFPRYDLVSIPGEGYRILVDLPGLEKDDVDVTISGQELTMAGERSRPELPEGSEVRRSERPYGRFRRTLEVPRDVDGTGIRAKMTDGVLEIALPRHERADRQRIDIDVE